MKIKIISIILLLNFLLACNHKENDIQVPICLDSSITNTKWELIKIIEKETGKVSLVPSDIKSIELIFRSNNKIALKNLCNYSFGKYGLKNNQIIITELGPATKVYCGETITNLEELLIEGLSNIKRYQISDKLEIESNSFLLIFKYIGKHDATIGKVLFATNAHILNSLFEIDVFIENKKVGTISGGSMYKDWECSCEKDKQHIGFVTSLKERTYKFSAINTKCQASNVISKWSGKVVVKGDDCSTIFLDVSSKK